MTDRIVPSICARLLATMDEEHALAHDVCENGHNWPHAQWEDLLRRLHIFYPVLYSAMEVANKACTMKLWTFDKSKFLINECIDNCIDGYEEELCDLHLIIVEKLRYALIERCRKALSSDEEVVVPAIPEKFETPSTPSVPKE